MGLSPFTWPVTALGLGHQGVQFTSLAVRVMAQGGILPIQNKVIQ